ncbi:MAG TPA: hypothetical protein VF510_11025, partial [Ktedonobacterales bacterium]
CAESTPYPTKRSGEVETETDGTPCGMQGMRRMRPATTRHVPRRPWSHSVGHQPVRARPPDRLQPPVFALLALPGCSPAPRDGDSRNGGPRCAQTCAHAGADEPIG